MFFHVFCSVFERSGIFFTGKIFSVLPPIFSPSPTVGVTFQSGCINRFHWSRQPLRVIYCANLRRSRLIRYCRLLGFATRTYGHFVFLLSTRIFAKLEFICAVGVRFYSEHFISMSLIWLDTFTLVHVGFWPTSKV